MPGCENPGGQGADGGGREVAAPRGGRRVLEGGARQQAGADQGGDRGSGEWEVIICRSHQIYLNRFCFWADFALCLKMANLDLTIFSGKPEDPC